MPPSRGFRVLARRWVVERTFAWISHNRRRIGKDLREVVHQQGGVHLRGDDTAHARAIGPCVTVSRQSFIGSQHLLGITSGQRMHGSSNGSPVRYQYGGNRGWGNHATNPMSSCTSLRRRRTSRVHHSLTPPRATGRCSKTHSASGY